MGEVYLAHDTKLNRDVALKILPQVFAQDQERMARFEREAQVLASLNHTHIAQIHGIEASNPLSLPLYHCLAGGADGPAHDASAVPGLSWGSTHL